MPLAFDDCMGHRRRRVTKPRHDAVKREQPTSDCKNQRQIG